MYSDMTCPKLRQDLLALRHFRCVSIGGKLAHPTFLAIDRSNLADPFGDVDCALEKASDSCITL
jgi:hypothetical protein